MAKLVIIADTTSIQNLSNEWPCYLHTIGKATYRVHHRGRTSWYYQLERREL